MKEADIQQLSRLLFEARETTEMLADIIHDKADGWCRRLVTEIDQYRTERGWNPHGFGGEKE